MAGSAGSGHGTSQTCLAAIGHICESFEAALQRVTISSIASILPGGNPGDAASQIEAGMATESSAAETALPIESPLPEGWNGLEQVMPTIFPAISQSVVMTLPEFSGIENLGMHWDFLEDLDQEPNDGQPERVSESKRPPDGGTGKLSHELQDFGDLAARGAGQTYPGESSQFDQKQHGVIFLPAVMGETSHPGRVESVDDDSRGTPVVRRPETPVPWLGRSNETTVLDETDFPAHVPAQAANEADRGDPVQPISTEDLPRPVLTGANFKNDIQAVTNADVRSPDAWQTNRSGGEDGQDSRFPLGQQALRDLSQNSVLMESGQPAPSEPKARAVADIALRGENTVPDALPGIPELPVQSEQRSHDGVASASSDSRRATREMEVSLASLLPSGNAPAKHIDAEVATGASALQEVGSVRQQRTNAFYSYAPDGSESSSSLPANSGHGMEHNPEDGFAAKHDNEWQSAFAEDTSPGNGAPRAITGDPLQANVTATAHADAPYPPAAERPVENPPEARASYEVSQSAGEYSVGNASRSAELRVAFQSEEYGTVEMRAVARNERVAATIAVESAEVRGLLSAQLPYLEQSLADRQIMLDAVVIADESSGAASGASQQSHSQAFSQPSSQDRFASQTPFGTSLSHLFRNSISPALPGDSTAPWTLAEIPGRLSLHV